jgi:malonyl-CoA/methylmalonyl-CoA synthetase
MDASCPFEMLTSYSDLLDAVLSYREVVKAALSETMRQSLNRGEEVYIGVLATGGWECKYLLLSTRPRRSC